VDVVLLGGVKGLVVTPSSLKLAAWPGGEVRLQVAAAANVPAGDYILTVLATSREIGGQAQTNFTVRVEAAGQGKR
jgi:hypothetical protein